MTGTAAPCVTAVLALVLSACGDISRDVIVAKTLPSIGDEPTQADVAPDGVASVAPDAGAPVDAAAADGSDGGGRAGDRARYGSRRRVSGDYRP